MKSAIHDIIHDEKLHMASFQLLSSFFFGIVVNNVNLIVLFLQLCGFLATLCSFYYYLFVSMGGVHFGACSCTPTREDSMGNNFNALFLSNFFE